MGREQTVSEIKLLLDLDGKSVFDAYFWQLYPRRKTTPTIQGNKKLIEKILRDAVKAEETTWPEIKTSVENYAQSDKVRDGYIQMPLTYVRAQGWNYEYEIPQSAEEILAAKPLAERTLDEWWKILGVRENLFMRDFLPRNWDSKRLGPPPGNQHCMVPDEIMTECGWRKWEKSYG